MWLTILAGFIVVPAMAYAIWYVAGYNPGAQKHWEILPTQVEYQAAHPQCCHGDVLTCCHCGSDQMLDLGLLSYTDWRRQIVCRGCKNRLWREWDK